MSDTTLQLFVLHVMLYLECKLSHSFFTIELIVLHVMLFIAWKLTQSVFFVFVFFLIHTSQIYPILKNVLQNIAIANRPRRSLDLVSSPLLLIICLVLDGKKRGNTSFACAFSSLIKPP